MKKIILFSLIIGFTAGSTDVFAQYNRINRKHIKRYYNSIADYKKGKHQKRKETYTGIGVSLNALGYAGDLSPTASRFSTDFSFTTPGIGIGVFHRFGPRYSLFGQLTYGSIKGSDAQSAKQASGDFVNFRQARNLSFRNRIKELSVVAVFDLFENKSFYYNRPSWTPYIYAGVAVFLQNPQAQAPKYYLDGITPTGLEGKWIDLQPLGTEGEQSKTSELKQYTNNGTTSTGNLNYGNKPYNLLQVSVPVGIGARFKLTKNLDLWADVGVRYTFTDYLDDVSKNYVNLASFTDPLAAALSYRTNELPTDILQKFQTKLGTTKISNVAVNNSGTRGDVTVVNGFGYEDKSNKRGTSKFHDLYIVSSIKVTYIIGALNSYNKVKYR